MTTIPAATSSKNFTAAFQAYYATLIMLSMIGRTAYDSSKDADIGYVENPRAKAA